MIADWQAASVPGWPTCGDPKWLPNDRSPRPDNREPPVEARKIKIIIIDDEAIIADTVVEILSEEGFEATAVSTGASAIELAEIFHPDIVLSDVIMPGMNGIEIGISIRQIAPKCRIILFQVKQRRSTC